MTKFETMLGMIAALIFSAISFEINLYYLGGAFAAVSFFTLSCLFLDYLTPGSVFKD